MQGLDEETPPEGEKTQIHLLTGAFLGGFFLLMVCAVAVCASRHVTPTLYNLVNTFAFTAPFAVTAINLLQAAHFSVAYAVYHKCRVKAYWLARIQLALTGVTHLSLLLVFFLLPFFGGGGGWTTPATVVLWGTWECSALLALQRVYRNRLWSERRIYKLSVVAFIFYVAPATTYIVLGFTNPESFALFVVECVLGLTIVLFLVLLVVHTKRVTFSVYGN